MMMDDEESRRLIWCLIIGGDFPNDWSAHLHNQRISHTRVGFAIICWCFSINSFIYFIVIFNTHTVMTFRKFVWFSPSLVTLSIIIQCPNGHSWKHVKQGEGWIFLKMINNWIIWITVHQHCILEQTMIHMVRNANAWINYKYITKWWQKQIHFRACPTFTAVYWLEHNFLPLSQATWAFLAMITLIQQALWQCFKYFFSAVNFSKKVFSGSHQPFWSTGLDFSLPSNFRQVTVSQENPTAVIFKPFQSCINCIYL